MLKQRNMQSHLFINGLELDFIIFTSGWLLSMLGSLSKKSFKQSGIDSFRCKDYVKALGYFSLAWESSPEDIEITEWRVKSFYELKEEEICLRHIAQCEVLSPEIMMVESKVYLDRHDFAKIDECTQKVSIMDNQTKFKSFLEDLRSISNLYKQYQDVRANEEYEQATHCLNQLISKLPNNKNTAKLRMQLLECVLKCGELSRARTILETFPTQSFNADLFGLRIQLYYYLRQEKEYKELIASAHSTYPGNEKLIKLESVIDETEFNLKQGKLLLQYKKYLQAIDIFTRGLAIDPWNKQVNSLFQFHKAITYSKLKSHNEAKQSFNRAISLNPLDVEIRKQRALFNIETKDYVAAVIDYEKLIEIDSGNREAYLKEIANLSKYGIVNGKLNYYGILNIQRHSGEEQIKRAYKLLAMKYHPDRNRHKSLAEIAENSYKFMQATEAYKALIDPQTRKNYDLSQSLDPEENAVSEPFRKNEKKDKSCESYQSVSDSSSRKDKTDESEEESEEESSRSSRSREKRSYDKYYSNNNGNNKRFTAYRGKDTQYKYRNNDNEEYSGNRFSSYKRNNQFTFNREKKPAYNHRERTY